MATGQNLPVKPESGGKRADGYCTPKQDRQPQVMCVPPKRVLPVIFIPGMMGSNLRQTSARQTADKHDIAWRPGDRDACAQLATAPVAERQSQLNPAATEVDTYDPVADPMGSSSISANQCNAEVKFGEFYDQSWTVDSPLLQDDLAMQLQLQDDGAQPHGSTRTRKVLARGWGEVCFGSYAKVLATCEERLNSPFSADGKVAGWWRENILDIDPLKWGAVPESKLVPLTDADFRLAMKRCWFPVHAMGYNWLESNAVSGKVIAKRIKKLIADYEAKGFECSKVILVTHSMGGLVARAACHPKIGGLDNDGLVLGIVHGVMPTLGMATAYKWMRCGFEGGDSSILRKVLGSTGREATAVLANAQGGLELLPGKGYGNYWLQAHHQGRKLLRIPQHGDPYEEIYKAEEKWYRLLNPAWINPAAIPGKGFKQSLALLDQAKAFHETIAGYFHERTFVHCGIDTQRRAWRNVVWEIDAEWLVRKVERSKLVSDNAAGQLAISDKEEQDGLTAHRAPHDGQGQRPSSANVTLQSPAAPGAETAPLHSADDQCGLDQLRGIFRQLGYEHEAGYKDERVLASTLYAIVRLVQEMRWENWTTSSKDVPALQPTAILKHAATETATGAMQFDAEVDRSNLDGSFWVDGFKPSSITHPAPEHVRKAMGATTQPSAPAAASQASGPVLTTRRKEVGTVPGATSAPAVEAGKSSVSAAGGGVRAERLIDQLQAAGMTLDMASSGSVSGSGRASVDQGFLDYANEMSLAGVNSDASVYAAEQAAIQARQSADAFLQDNPGATDQQLLDAYMSSYNYQYNTTMGGMINMTSGSYAAGDRMADFARAAGADFKDFIGTNNGNTQMGSGVSSVAENEREWDAYRRMLEDQGADDDGELGRDGLEELLDTDRPPGNALGSNPTGSSSTTDGANPTAGNGSFNVDPVSRAASARSSGEVSDSDRLPDSSTTAGMSFDNVDTSNIDWTKHPDYVGTTADGTPLFVDHNAPVVGVQNAVQPSDIVLGKGNPFAPEGSRISYYAGTPVFSTPNDPTTYYGFGNNVDKVNEYLADQQKSEAVEAAMQVGAQEVAQFNSELAEWQATHSGSDVGASFGESPVPESGSKTVKQIAAHNESIVNTATDPDGWAAVGKGSLNVASATGAWLTGTTGPDGRLIYPSLRACQNFCVSGVMK